MAVLFPHHTVAQMVTVLPLLLSMEAVRQQLSAPVARPYVLTEVVNQVLPLVLQVLLAKDQKSFVQTSNVLKIAQQFHQPVSALRHQLL